jgi:putative endonuclease
MNKFGQKGEDLACEFLQKKGFEIKVRNYRYKRAEVDIIAQSSKMLVFVEVKARSGVAFGNPEDSIDSKKENLILSAAENYMHENNTDINIRFDVISILKTGEKYSIEHIEDAFG